MNDTRLLTGQKADQKHPVSGSFLQHAATRVLAKLRLLISLSLVCVLAACTSEEDKNLAAGKELYTKVCKVCHAQGINGAPILGNQKMWKKRAPQGLETLVDHAENGYGLMPAKGGKEELTRDEITNAVKYMLSQLSQ